VIVLVCPLVQVESTTNDEFEYENPPVASRGAAIELFNDTTKKQLVGEMYKEVMEDCTHEDLMHCMDAGYKPNCTTTLEKFQAADIRDCWGWGIYTKDDVMVSSGWNVEQKTSNKSYFVGIGLTVPMTKHNYTEEEIEEMNACHPASKCVQDPEKNRTKVEFDKKIKQDLLFFGVGRPKGDHTNKNDRAFYGWIEEVKRGKVNYKKIEWMHNSFHKGSEVSKATPWSEMATFKDPPLMHKFKLWRGTPVMKFKMKLPPTSHFAMPREEMDKNRYLKKEKYMAWLNLTEKFNVLLLEGEWQGDKIISFSDMFSSTGEVPIFNANYDQRTTRITPTFYLPNGTIANANVED